MTSYPHLGIVLSTWVLKFNKDGMGAQASISRVPSCSCFGIRGFGESLLEELVWGPEHATDSPCRGQPEWEF